MSGSDPGPAAPTPKRRQGFWLTAGEIVGVLALGVAGLNYWDSRQQHAEDERRVEAQSLAAVSFVAVGEADREGRTVTLRPLKNAQAIESQRYGFPKEVLDHPMNITAARPRIQADWVIGGLRHVLEEVHAESSGSARVPVLIDTTFVEDGETRTDVSLYQLGFTWKKAFLSGWRIRLEGLALIRRDPGADAKARMENNWTATKAALSGGSATP